MLKVKNLEQVFSDLDRWLAEAEAKAAMVARGLAYEALRTLTLHSPQYSGDFAANWNVSVGAPDKGFHGQLLPLYRGAHVRGDPAAIAHAMTQAVGKTATFQLGDTIWLSNSARHDETYAWKIEDNKIKFRPGNYGETIRITIEEMKVRYTNVSRSDADQLIAGAL